MAKLLGIAILCISSLVTCSPVNSDNGGTYDGDFDFVARQQTEEAYQSLKSSMFSRIERSCIVCVSSATAIDDKETSRLLAESILDAEGKAYMSYFENQLSTLNSNEYGGTGIPKNDIDEKCTGFTKDLMSGILAVLASGNVDSNILNNLAPSVRSEVVKRYQDDLAAEDSFSCLDIALSDDPVS